MSKYVAVVSGGLDSICYLAQNIDHNEIFPMIFNYGQKAQKEVDVATKLLDEISKRFRWVRYRKILDIKFMKELWPGTQLTSSVKVEEAYNPSIVVPLRNAVFMTIAMAFAKSIDADRLLVGSHTDDTAPYGGMPMYPDSTKDFIMRLEETLHRGHFWWASPKVEIWFPGRNGMSKVANLKKGYEVLQDMVYETWSCYQSGEKHCGICESCRNRKKAFKQAGITDKTRYTK